MCCCTGIDTSRGRGRSLTYYPTAVCYTFTWYLTRNVTTAGVRSSPHHTCVSGLERRFSMDDRRHHLRQNKKSAKKRETRIASSVYDINNKCFSKETTQSQSRFIGSGLQHARQLCCPMIAFEHGLMNWGFRRHATRGFETVLIDTRFVRAFAVYVCLRSESNFKSN